MVVALSVSSNVVKWKSAGLLLSIGMVAALGTRTNVIEWTSAGLPLSLDRWRPSGPSAARSSGRRPSCC
ncbi:hypothetical protein PF010_g18591 [Phytophthora fragariae]|uniref:Uncharacterized protein n=1 Tax=Phytophthora fragariae TaxID=53985 RepID=A0A6G0KJW2_9STRA|nr:hypothetical protein PF010_g18591 [Phytophthora fragariae]